MHRQLTNCIAFSHKKMFPVIIVKKLVKKFKKAGLVIDIRFPGLSLTS